MHSALWHLLWMEFRGSLRGMANVHRNWKQAILVLLMVGFVGLLVGIRWLNPDQGPSGRFGPAMPFWSLLYLSLTWITASADRGLIMRPAEIHFVAGGPFHSRDVITLNLVRLAYRALIASCVISLLALAYVESYASTMVGMWLLMAVSLLVGMVASLSARRTLNRYVRVLRRLFNALAILTLVVLIFESLQLIRERGDSPQITTVAATAAETALGQWILPPLAWMFAPLSSSEFFPTTVSMLPARIALVSALVAIVYLLGGNYLESTARRTDLSMLKRLSAQRSGVVGHPATRAWTSRISIPSFGYCGGVGGIAWMQTLHAMRVFPRYFLFTSVIVFIILVIPLSVDSTRIAGVQSIVWMAGLTLYSDFLLLLQLPVGFLGPVSQRELLKTLPIPNWRIVFGMLAAPVIPLATIHACVLLLFLYLLPQDPLLVLTTALALIPCAAVLIANVNLLGSWNIIRPRALQQRDAFAAGRAMASVWIFGMMLTPAMLMGSIIATATAAGTGGSLYGIILGGSVGVGVSCAFYIYLLTRSFRLWQPTAMEAGKEEVEAER